MPTFIIESPFTFKIKDSPCGKISAGQPIFAEENIESYFPVPAELVPNGEPSYILKVRGDSMINAGIHDGDQIFVHSCREARNGQMVVALIDDSATVTYIRD